MSCGEIKVTYPWNFSILIVWKNRENGNQYNCAREWCIKSNSDYFLTNIIKTKICLNYCILFSNTQMASRVMIPSHHHQNHEYRNLGEQPLIKY